METMRPNHARAIAGLHARCIATGFLSTLGEPFLARLYQAIANDPQSIVLVSVSPDDTAGRTIALGNPPIAGFVAATRDTRAMYRRILRRHWFTFALLLLPRAFSPRVVKHILETMTYARHPGHKAPQASKSKQAELLSIAVDPNARGAGIGRALVQELEDWLSRRSENVDGMTREEPVAPYRVVTSAQDPVSNAFYDSCGFALVDTFRHHGNPMNVYHRKPRMLSRDTSVD
ncbi:MAG: GNAT family N-acetyltransferase [Chitinivibrionales bacterium]|nr:GNAT family N-acetyltransferase [Chitinivibrionales bacterium]